MNQIEQTLDSREVAEMVGKRHDHLIRDIKKYIGEMSAPNFGEGNELKIEPVDFFREAIYKDAKGLNRPCYDITKKGCEFIAHKLTGIKGTEFTARYINRFHDMENQIINPLEGISPELQAVIVVDKRVTQVEQKVSSVKQELEDFKQDMPLLAVECDRITTAVHKRGVDALGGKKSNAYKDASLRGKVYQDIHRELKRQFGVSTYKAIKRSQCEVAVSIIAEYELPFVLQEQIENCNAQISMEVA